ncbi:MAG: hypothetical protein CL534_04320 [Ahrensia sp.]|nr:hypothetical protein [Ahrensia sp.]
MTDERHLDPTPHRELERRWRILRDVMKEEGLDAILCQSSSNLSGSAGYLRWMTGYSAMNPYTVVGILPAEEPLVMVRHGAFDGRQVASPEMRAMGFGDVLTTPSLPAVDYTGGYDAALVKDYLSSIRARRVGILGRAGMYFGFGSELYRLSSGEIELVDVTDRVDPFKAQKSEDEIEMIRVAAKMQDDSIAKLAEFIRPGLTDLEIIAYAQYIGQTLGSETGFFLGSSFEFGDGSLPLRHRTELGRTVREGDLMYLLLENSGPGGIFTHIGRFFSVGEPPAVLEDTFQDVLETRIFHLGQFEMGRECADIFAEYNSYMREHGYPEEKRLHSHGQGLDVVERPLIRSDETMRIMPNLNMGIHPFIFDETKFVTCCDNYLFRSDGTMERLHAAPEEIIRVTP